MPDDAKLGSRDQPKYSLSLQSLYNILNPIPFQLFNQFRGTTLKPHTKTSFESLPNEILLEIFLHLELKPYIMSHGVCKKWRQLLPLIKLHPIRERLLSLYRRILNTPGFEQTQEWSTQHLQPFDREEYIQCLLQQHPIIPEEFRMWILEWPARLLVQSTWPGIPLLDCDADDPIVRRSGVNWIAYRTFSPRLSSLTYRYGGPFKTFVPGLLIWHYSTVTDFLIFGHEGPDLFGQVMVTLAEYHDAGHIPYYPRQPTTDESDSDDKDDSDSDDSDSDDSDSDDSDSGDDNDSESVISEGEQCLEIHDDWICYLENLWDKSIKEIRILRKTYPGHDYPVDQPVPCEFNSNDTTTLPAPAWDSCQRTSMIRTSMSTNETTSEGPLFTPLSAPKPLISQTTSSMLVRGSSLASESRMDSQSHITPNSVKADLGEHLDVIFIDRGPTEDMVLNLTWSTAKKKTVKAVYWD